MRLPRQHARSDAVERTDIPELKENHHDVRDPLTSAKEDRKILPHAETHGINQTKFRAGALSYGVGWSLHVGKKWLKQQSVLRRHNLTWNGSPISTSVLDRARAPTD